MNTTITIYGASDDLIEVEGDIREEFYSNSANENDYIACSDGTVLSIIYGAGGLWRISRVAVGTAEYSKVEAVDAESEDYSDKVTLTGDIKWIVCGRNFNKAKAA